MIGKHIPLRSAMATVVILVACLALGSARPAMGAGPDPRAGSTRLPKGVTADTKSAIDRGLAYLARTQDRDGSWASQGRYASYPVALTSLASLALLMDGNTTTQGRYAAHVDRATNFLLRSATPSGLITREEGEARPMYGHGFAVLFLSQLHGMVEESSRSERIQNVLSAGVGLTARSQSRLGGWFYTPDSRSDEGSVTITQVQALRSCRNAGVAVPKEVVDTAMEYLAISQNTDGGIRYTASQRSGTSRPAITAAAVCCWFNAGLYDSPRAKQALSYCKEKIKPGKTKGGHDYYAHFYLAQALYVSGDSSWDKYYAKLSKRFLRQQQEDGAWFGDGVGKTYGTSLALMILQLPYNQLPIMQP